MRLYQGDHFCVFKTKQNKKRIFLTVLSGVWLCVCVGGGGGAIFVCLIVAIFLFFTEKKSETRTTASN